MSKESIYNCPKCGKKLLEEKEFLFCAEKECKFKLYTNYFGEKLSEKDINELFKKGLTGRIFKPKGKKEARLRLSRTTWKLEPDYIKKEIFLSKEVGKCPKCGGIVIEKERGFFCKKKECGFVIWRNYFEAVIEREDAEAILKDGITLRKFKMKNNVGKRFMGFLKLDPDTFQIIYEFH